MFRKRSDLPLEKDDSSRFIPWIIALMVYLASLALAGALAAGGAVERWSQGLSGALTVQIPPTDDADAKARSLRIESAITLLESTPGVVQARALSDEQIGKLLAPWLGEAAAASDLPLPAIIDVRIDPTIPLDLQALAQHLARAVPGATLDDHQRWLHELISVGQSVELVAALILALVALAAALAIVFGTRAALAVHHNVIEVMHLIGAQDSYVARQFQAHAMRIALRGGITGLLGAIATLVGIEYLVDASGSGFLPNLALRPWQWGALVFLPFITAAIAVLTARMTVVRTLARMV